MFVLVFRLWKSSSGVTSSLDYHWWQFVGFFTSAAPFCELLWRWHGARTVLKVRVFWTPSTPDSSVSAVVADSIEEERLRQLLCRDGKHATPRHTLFIPSHYCARFIHTLPHKCHCSQMSIQNLYIILSMPTMCCGSHCECCYAALTNSLKFLGGFLGSKCTCDTDL